MHGLCLKRRQTNNNAPDAGSCEVVWSTELIRPALLLSHYPLERLEILHQVCRSGAPSAARAFSSLTPEEARKGETLGLQQHMCRCMSAATPRLDLQALAQTSMQEKAICLQVVGGCLKSCYLR